MKYGLKGICAAFVLVAACNTSHNYPVIGGGGGGGGVGTDAGSHLDGATDAAGDAIGDAATDAVPGDGGISGQVCLLTDLRDLTTCAPTGAGGLTVTLGSSSATTTDNGSFTLAAPTGTGLVWQVTGSAIETSSMAYGAETTIPAVKATDYVDLLANNLVPLPAMGQGAIMTRITRANTPVAGATASATPPPYQTYYAGSDATVWSTVATGATGTAWLPDLAATAPATLTVAASGGTPSATFSVTVPDSGIAFVMPDLAP